MLYRCCYTLDQNNQTPTFAEWGFLLSGTVFLLAGREGFEPTTSRFGDERSTGLS